MTQSKLSDFLDAPSVPCGFNASDIEEYQYKIHDDSIRPRHFLDADNKDGIEAIFSEREGHSLHEFIDGDESLRPIIDFDLPVETLNTIFLKFSDKQAKNILCNAFKKVCLEIFSDWDKKTITIVESSNVKKISLYVSTFNMRLLNITKASVFTELIHKKLLVGLQKKGIIDNIANIGPSKSFSLRMLRSPKYDKKTEEHVRVKKAIRSKNRTIFDFMICPPNDDSKVIDSPLLAISEPEVKRCLTKENENNDISNETTQIEFDFVKSLLRENSIEEYSLSYPSENFSDKFSLSRISSSHCPLCDREHTSDNAYIIRNKKSYSFKCYRANHERNHE